MLTKPRTLHDRLMVVLLFVQLVALFVGTLMPGAVRNGIERGIESSLALPSLPLSPLAHLVLFASMAVVLSRRPFHWDTLRVGFTALALALLSEGLQHFAIDRHPRWLDVGIDVSGALLGLIVGGLVSLCFARP